MNNSTGWKTPEPKMRNPRVKALFDKWRKVWLMSLERDRKLKETLDRLKEVYTCDVRINFPASAYNLCIF
jgi:hypothetical protein